MEFMWNFIVLGGCSLISLATLKFPVHDVAGAIWIGVMILAYDYILPLAALSGIIIGCAEIAYSHWDHRKFNVRNK